MMMVNNPMMGNNPMMMGMAPPPINFQNTWTTTNGVTHLNVTTVGPKTQERNVGLQILRIMFICLIFPICLPCFMCWNSKVYPKWEVNEELYRAIGRFIRRSPYCTVVNLTVADNAFNNEKAMILYDGLIGSTLTTFTFTNIALACDGKNQEATNFIQNVAQLKDMGSITASFTWGGMTI